MTPLMMLALTLPPSLAFVAVRLLAWLEQNARTSIADDIEAFRKLKERVEQIEARVNIHDQDHDGTRDGLDKHDAEIARLNEQITILASNR